MRSVSIARETLTEFRFATWRLGYLCIATTILTACSGGSASAPGTTTPTLTFEDLRS